MGHDPKGVKSPTWGILGYFGQNVQNRHNDRKKGKKGKMANMAKRPELAIFGVSAPQKSIFGYGDCTMVPKEATQNQAKGVQNGGLGPPD
jgi:hypothetical protein